MSIRMRHTSSHTKNRRSHHALKSMNVIRDASDARKIRLPHRVDEATGMYRGKQIFTPRARKVAGERARVAHPKAHLHDSEPAKQEKKSVVEKVSALRPRSRSGMGGGA